MRQLSRPSVTRREFLGGAAAAGAVALLGRPTRVRGANDDIRVGFIGLGRRGASTITWFRHIPGVRIAGLCDVDREYLAREHRNCVEFGESPITCTDARELLDDPSIDAVAICTCNHTHTLLTIWACQAGKDVYVEKPVSHNLYEGQRLIAALEKYEDRIVETGTQNRSDSGLASAFQAIGQGELGEIRLVRGLCYNQRDPIGKVSGPQAIPASVDYNLWCGPAPVQPLMRKRLHYDWHWDWMTGNGDVGNQGLHELDLAQWVLGEPGPPRSVLSIGGRFTWEDDGQTANTQVVWYDYAAAPVVFEMRHLGTAAQTNTMDQLQGVRVGIVVECEYGYFAGGRGGGWLYDADGRRLRQFRGDGGGTHARNFIDAMRDRDRQRLRADVNRGVASADMAHLANISLRCGRTASPEQIELAAALTPSMADAWERMRTHLLRNNVALDAAPATLGALLRFDAESHRLVHDEPNVQRLADALSHPTYREPFTFGPDA